ncbi:N(6)-adenine-specific methyltransferase METTL4 [Drosophila innubila]|uniref:N(6)-adenine-specific methyltransferase METTL4 n=1 Tax=Drosophila innubila TaxID=198719 RepID=UPI00148C5E25|nr:N(6)-adenine-specific methyltransferase METTL4 [Drosophila innubila]
MIKLQSKYNKDKHALLLNHRQLINEAYKAAVADNETYQLKLQLFNFQQRTTEQQLQQKLKKGKRKLDEAANDDEVDNIKEYLELLPKATENNAKTTLPRHWEDVYKLPQLHGSNISGKFQKFQVPGSNFNSTSRTFIIPQSVRFYNHDVEQMTALLPQLLSNYDLIILDPPWRNKYIRRLKRSKQELGYAMLDNDKLALLPLRQLTHEHTLVAIWCTNSTAHQQALETQLLPSWRLRLLHKLRWYKLNTEHQLIGNLNPADATQKQPYEMLYIACRADSDVTYALGVKQTEMLLSVPSIIHSHKPPLLEWLRQHLQLSGDQAEPNCLELFARYLQPNFTSIGLEVLKLMDERLYDCILTKI